MMYVRNNNNYENCGEKTAFAERAVPNLASLRFGFFFSCRTARESLAGETGFFCGKTVDEGIFFSPAPMTRGPKRNETRDGPVRQYRHFISGGVVFSLPLVIVRRGPHYRTQACRESGRASGRLQRVRARKVRGRRVTSSLSRVYIVALERTTAATRLVSTISDAARVAGERGICGGRVREGPDDFTH